MFHPHSSWHPRYQILHSNLGQKRELPIVFLQKTHIRLQQPLETKAEVLVWAASSWQGAKQLFQRQLLKTWLCLRSMNSKLLHLNRRPTRTSSATESISIKNNFVQESQSSYENVHYRSCLTLGHIQRTSQVFLQLGWTRPWAPRADTGLSCAGLDQATTSGPPNLNYSMV